MNEEMVKLIAARTKKAFKAWQNDRGWGGPKLDKFMDLLEDLFTTIEQS